MWNGSDLEKDYFLHCTNDTTISLFSLMEYTLICYCSEVMNMWGGKMTDALFTLAEMAAVGFEMPSKDAFTSRMLFGPHLLAPTGINSAIIPDSTAS